MNSSAHHVYVSEYRKTHADTHNTYTRRQILNEKLIKTNIPLEQFANIFDIKIKEL